MVYKEMIPKWAQLTPEQRWVEATAVQGRVRARKRMEGGDVRSRRPPAKIVV